MEAIRGFSKFFQFTKVDEAKREVGGTVTAEVEDKDGEICHYKTTVPYYEEWSEELVKASGGKNCGNLREMHGLSAAGSGKSLVFDDVKKSIFMTFKVVDDAAWNKVQEGVYTGFSQGGDYIKVWMEDGKKFYTAKPSEVSLVDNPCLGTATFDFIRADGHVEVRKFKSVERGEKVEKTEAISLDQVKTLIDEALMKGKKDERAAAEAVTKDAARKASITIQVAELIKGVQAKLEKADGKVVRKSIYAVKQLADILESICYLRISAAYEREYEQDNSKLPDKLQADLEQLAETFLAMTEEEVGELTTAAAEAGQSKPGGLYMTTKGEGLEKAAAKSLADHLKKMADCVTAHHEKVRKAHSDHADEMQAHIAKVHKIMGVEEAKDGDEGAPKNIDPTTVGAGSFAMATTPEQLKKMIDEAVEKVSKAADERVTKAIEDANKVAEERVAKAAQETEDKVVDLFIKALKGDEEAAGAEGDLNKAKVTEKAVEKVDPQPGVGDRNAVVSKGAQIRTMPVRKADDEQIEVVAAAARNAEPVDMNKVAAGDREEILKFMKGSKPAELPPTIADQIARRSPR
jgi:hypothetical protein